MKKISLILVFTIMTLFAYVNNVSADSSSFLVNYDPSSGLLNNYSYSQMKAYYENYSDAILDIFENRYNDWLENYSSTYPYYFVNLVWNTSTSFQLEFVATSTLPTIPYLDPNYNIPFQLWSFSSYSTSNVHYGEFTVNPGSFTFYSKYNNQNKSHLYANRYFYSNFNLYFSGFPSSITDLAYETFTDNNTITRSWLTDANAPVTNLYDYFGLSFLEEYSPSNYVDVNLNDYAYVVISLKDYTNLISPVEFYVKGQLCATPVYDYGMREKTVTDRCSVTYSDFTPVRLYISTTDLQNKIVFYLSAFDTSISNIVKVDANIFDISYITSNNASEPTIIVDGRPYSVIPYQDLTTSATKNEEADFIPGVTCAIGDINCQAEASGMDISDLFSKPLELLESLWSSITTFFTIITTFITILPPTLQTFLYVSFMLAVILGIIKIIIG